MSVSARALLRGHLGNGSRRTGSPPSNAGLPASPALAARPVKKAPAVAAKPINVRRSVGFFMVVPCSA